MKNFCILFTSKNNYPLYNQIFFAKSNVNFDDILIFNVDCDSTLENYQNGLQICKGLNIIDLPTNGNGKSLPVMKAIEMAEEYLIQNKLDHIEWISVCQQDMYFKTENAFDKMESFLRDEDFLKNVGSIGLAVDGIQNERVYSRGNLLGGMIDDVINGYLRNVPDSYLNVDYFLVEATYWDTVFINRKLFKKYIVPDYDLILNFWGDDLSNQFLANNICNVTLPNIIAHDDHSYKNIIGFPSCNREYNYFYHGDHWDHHKIWNKKYGYHMFYNLDASDTEGRKQKRIEIYNLFRDRYIGTLVDEMFSWHMNDGPKNLDDVRNYLEGRKSEAYFQK